MASPVTGLTATPNPSECWTTLAWTNPGAGETGIVIEMQSTRDLIWTRVYDQPVVSTKNVYPSCLTPFNFRVATRDGGGLSSWVIVGPSILQGRTVRGYPVILISTRDGSKVALGAGASLDNNAWQTVTTQVPIQPPQDQDPVYFFPKQSTLTAQQLTFSVFNADPLGDGSPTIIYGDDIVATLRRFQTERHPILYRDVKQYELYIWVWGVSVAPKVGIHQTVTFVPQRRKTPAVRYTT